MLTMACNVIGMGRAFLWILAMLPSLLPWAAAAAEPPPTVNLHYQAFAHGLAILAMDVSVTLAPSGYQVTLSYHTTGLAGFLYPGHQADAVGGTWDGDRAAPRQYTGAGVWRGVTRRIDIAYHDERPQILMLLPPITEEREPVSPALQAGTEDTLSTLAQLVRRVETTGSCDTSARTFDGRRLSQIDARTVGIESVQATQRSMFAGPALRCDFTGHMLAGFELHDRATDQRPMHGSAWFASIGGAPAVPVRMRFETRWFGDVTMFLTDATTKPQPLAQAAAALP